MHCIPGSEPRSGERQRQRWMCGNRRQHSRVAPLSAAGRNTCPVSEGGREGEVSEGVENVSE